MSEKSRGRGAHYQFDNHKTVKFFQLTHDMANTQEPKPNIPVQNVAPPHNASDQNQNINKQSPIGYAAGQAMRPNNPDGKHHDQQRLTHEQVNY